MDGMAIRADSLTRIFSSVRAVDDLRLDVPTGSVFGFLGPNGAGKTTTIRLLLGLLEPSSGKAEVLGLDTMKEGGRIRKKTGALLEHPGLYERLTPEDNLEFFGRVWRLPSSSRKDRIRELLTHLGLWDRRNELVRTWSRGMKQKLAVARALLHRPSLLFLDEPTAGLDPIAAAALRDDLSGLVAREGLTVFLTTHNLAEAEKLCHQVGVISRGKLLAQGTPDDLRTRNGALQVEIIGRGIDDGILARLRERPEVESAERRNGRMILGLKENADTAPLVALLVHAGVAVEEVRKGSESLEEAFLTLVREEDVNQ